MSWSGASASSGSSATCSVWGTAAASDLSQPRFPHLPSRRRVEEWRHLSRLPSWRLASTPCWRLVPTAGGGPEEACPPGMLTRAHVGGQGERCFFRPLVCLGRELRCLCPYLCQCLRLCLCPCLHLCLRLRGRGAEGTRAGRRQGATGGSPDGTAPQSPVASPESDCQIAHLRLGGERGGRSTNPLFRDPPCTTESVAAMSPSPSQEVPGYRIGTILFAVGTPESLLG